ncbi:hypothetical protein ACWEVD_25380 [Nocardia thailandica]
MTSQLNEAELFARARGSAEPDDRRISIEVDPNGRIIRLYIADYALEDGADTLAASIAESHRIASSRAINSLVDDLRVIPDDRADPTQIHHTQNTGTEASARDIRKLNAAIDDIRGESSSSDGAVSLTCDVFGTVTNLVLQDYCMDRGGSHLAHQIAKAHRDARAAALEQADNVHGTIDI